MPKGIVSLRYEIGGVVKGGGIAHGSKLRGERQTDRQTERQRDRQKERKRQRDRQTERDSLKYES